MEKGRKDARTQGRMDGSKDERKGERGEGRKVRISWPIPNYFLMQQCNLFPFYAIINSPQPC